MHDRFLIIDNGKETSYYSMSNSWNGSVNNYSIFIQEINLSDSLKLKDCYANCFADQYLQKKELKKEKNIIKKRFNCKKR